MIDYSGHLAAVFFLGGCNFRCRYCHNPDLVADKMTGLTWEKLRQCAESFARNWVDAAVVTGGEPTLHEDLPRCLNLFRGLGWRIKLDTNGSNPDMLEKCLPLTDFVAMDIKAGRAGYAGLTGFVHPEKIERSIGLMRERARDYCFRTTIVESFHGDTEIHEIGAWIRGARLWILQPFVPRETLLDPTWSALPRTSPQRLAAVARIAQDYVETVRTGG